VVAHRVVHGQLSRESPLFEVGFSISGQTVADVLEARTADLPAPVSITVDHGSECTSNAVEDWAWRRAGQDRSLACRSQSATTPQRT